MAGFHIPKNNIKQPHDQDINVESFKMLACPHSGIFNFGIPLQSYVHRFVLLLDADD